MERRAIKAFWNCGDNNLIEYAMVRARLNKNEREVLYNILDECFTQEETAEIMETSTRRIQEIWANATEKLLNLPWLRAYAEALIKY